MEVDFKRLRWSRSLRLRIRDDGTVLFSMPMRASLRAAEDFIQSKAELILNALEKYRARGGKTRTEKQTDYKLHHKRALAIACERVAYFAPQLGVAYKKISVRNQSTRWGSCSRTGTLCFHYKIAIMPPPVADYLVIHELCHLLEFNHSPRFWAHVERFSPDARQHRKYLRNISKI
ncbi:MAG: SprT family zinc-dependent metalloprotease [bacterium]